MSLFEQIAQQAYGDKLTKELIKERDKQDKIKEVVTKIEHKYTDKPGIILTKRIRE